MTATVSPIDNLMARGWPASRAERKREARATADSGLRTVICGNCEAESPALDGPSGRAWWDAHRCRALRVIR